jgi:hypothetical protein
MVFSDTDPNPSLSAILTSCPKAILSRARNIYRGHWMAMGTELEGPKSSVTRFPLPMPLHICEGRNAQIIEVGADTKLCEDIKSYSFHGNPCEEILNPQMKKELNR